ncbi:hypothetical protein CPB83DRAFT_842736 [Crepidotus variabilis]|uniref:Pentatricopeptide repeat-containing protein n=1 Tax=Crepidotus variabilis TaxID=179855 RepID=A0A9P6ETE4_9AGAR|nr:hypothetical protein CPB83DRAFT_842736 [Crepidotus variabilis]
MVEPFSGVLTSLLPRHSIVKQSSSLKRVVNRNGRASLTSNFFTPAPRYDKGKAKAVEESPPLEEEVLGCQSWAQPFSQKGAWSQDGVMRSLLTDEIQEGSSSNRRVPRTSTFSRRRFRQSFPFTGPNAKALSRDTSSFSTSPVQQAAAAPALTTVFRPQTEHISETKSPYRALLNALDNPVMFRKDPPNISALFKQARKSGVFETLPPQEAIVLLNKLADYVDSMCVALIGKELLQEWGTKLWMVYSQLPLDIVEGLKKDRKWAPLMSRILSFNGRFEEAVKTLQQFHLADYGNIGYRKAVDSHLIALARYKGVYYSLDFWAQEDSRRQFPSKSCFGELVARDSMLAAAFGKVAKIQDLDLRSRIFRYCLKMALAYSSVQQALVTISASRNWSVEPQLELCLDVCKLLASQDDLPAAKKLFDTIPPNPHKYYSQTNLYICARLGNLEVTKRIIDERRQAGYLTAEDMTNFFIALSKAQRYAEMKEYFEAGCPVGPDGRRTPAPRLNQYSVCILANARAGNLEQVNWWLEDMDKNGVKPNLKIFTHLMTLFKRVGDDRSMTLAYNNMLQANICPDPRLYTVMFSHFAIRKNTKAADALFQDALRLGVVPDEKMTSALMNVYAQAGSWKSALSIFRDLSKQIGRSKPSLSVYNVMFQTHLLLGAPFKVMTELFLKLKYRIRIQPNQHTYAILITSACESGHLSVALDLVKEIKQTQKTQNRSDLLSVHIMTVIMSTCLKHNEKAKAKEILDEMLSLGMRPTDVTYAQIIKYLGASRMQGDLDQAEEFVKGFLESPEELDRLGEVSKKKQPIANIYLPLLAGPAERGDYVEVERLFEAFLKASGRPSIAIYHKLLLTYRNAGELGKAMDVWPLIWDLAESEPFVKDPLPGESPEIEETDIHMANIQAPLSIYMDILSKTGKHHQLADVWFTLQRRGFGFDIQNWNFLVVVLIRAGQLERAFEVMEKIILPNQRSNEINDDIALRNRSQNTGKPYPLPPYIEVPQGHPLWGSEDRSRVHKLAMHGKGRSRSKAINIKIIDQNFVYPIRVLEFIRPSWNDWRPHEVVMRTLLAVYLLLQHGFVPKPLTRGGTLVNEVAVHDISERNPREAEDMLSTLGNKYPWTMESVAAFRRAEQTRLTREEFEHLYVHR